MAAKIYWNVLVFFGVLSQGIIGSVSEQDIEESSALLHRQKRVINLNPDGDVIEHIRNVPYVVYLKPLRRHNSCVGVILSIKIVLTSAECVESEIENYRVYSGNAQIIAGRSNARIHNITAKRTSVNNHPYRPKDGIALVTVTPFFVYSVNTRNIEFYEGHLHPGLHVLVSGWGCNPTGHPGTQHPKHLRSISVPIISNNDCSILYLNAYVITESDICILDTTEKQYCGANDEGAPLVIENGYRNYLVGIHLWKGRISGRYNPDVFANLQEPRYKSWIRQTIPIMEASAHG